MIFRFFGQLTAKRAPAVIGAWIAFVVLALVVAPEWTSVIKNGEFAFLPADSPSVKASELFRKSFPEHSTSSNIVIVIRRESATGLIPQDEDFIVDLVKHLERLLVDLESEGIRNPVQKLLWADPDNKRGRLYESEDGKASLIVLELDTEFLDEANRDFIKRIETELEKLHRIAVNRTATSTDSDVPSPSAIPPGLDIAFSGTAIYGRDAILESQRSAKATETWTVILVIVLLLFLYRAPFLAMIPLVTVGVSGTIALKLLSIAALWGWLDLFNGIEAYVTVLVYGAGIDYCLFLIARYREELLGGATIEDALTLTLERVGSAIAASAGTTMCGIGMMYFAEFGKFQQAGVAISFGLFICLIASLTLTPAIIRLCGRWAFWPRMPATQSSQGSWVSRPDVLHHLLSRAIPKFDWSRVGNLLRLKPWTMWLGSVLGLLPFSIIGYICFGYLSYGLLSDLPFDAPSANGAHALQQHFPGGEGVPVRVILKVPGANFSKLSPRPPRQLVEFTEAVMDRKAELGIETVRSLADPTGGRELGTLAAARAHFARKIYASSEDKEITRLDIIFRNDPFSRSSLDEFANLREVLPTLLPDSMNGTQIALAGETANLSDLKNVTDRDRTRINTLVTLVVFVILWILLRRLKVCVYLILTVLFSYFATLGGTYLFFWAMDPSGFSGLDWKVPMFLFTILIAVGEDYNIFLLTRIEEERKNRGRTESITAALDHTGSIISSCGIIMAGTFSSLMAGSLAGMDQLGFALALGVFLDTFVVRPVMVPAFLILMAERRLPLISDEIEASTEKQTESRDD